MKDISEERRLSVTRMALRRFLNEAIARANEAAQDKGNRFYGSGAVDSFMDDANDAMTCLELLDETERSATVRYDLEPAARKTSIHDQLISLGWTPPTPTPLSEVPESGKVWVVDIRAHYREGRSVAYTLNKSSGAEQAVENRLAYASKEDAKAANAVMLASVRVYP